MLPGDTVILREVVTSGKKIAYAKAGDKVKIIFISTPAVVVEDKKMRRFPTVLDNLIKTTVPAGSSANKS